MTELEYLVSEANKTAQTDYANWKSELSTEDREAVEEAEGTEDYEAVLADLIAKTYNPF